MLSGCDILNEDYEHAEEVWKCFDMKDMRNYHDLYLKTNVLLLADLFKNFRGIRLKNCERDPAWYFTARGLAWNACLKESGVQLELLNDPDMLLMIEKGISGGVSMISTRYSKAINKYMGEKFNPDEQEKYAVSGCKQLAWLGDEPTFACWKIEVGA